MSSKIEPKDLFDSIALSDLSYAKSSDEIKYSLPTLPGWEPVNGWDLGFSTGIFFGGNRDNYLFNNLGAQAFVAKNGGTLALVFTGSIPLGDAWNNLSDWPEIVSDWLVTDALDSSSANWSFRYSLYSSLTQNVTELFQEGGFDRLLVTGHSMGGALVEKFLDQNSEVGNVHGIAIASPGITSFNRFGEKLLNVDHLQDQVVDSQIGFNPPLGENLDVDLLWASLGVLEHPPMAYQHTISTIFGSYQDGLFVEKPFAREISSKPSQFYIVIGNDQADLFSADPEIWDEKQKKYAIFSGNGFDKIFGTNRRDLIDGGIGNDTIEGQGGDDFLYGAEDNDLLRGGEGNDELDGGSGEDTAILEYDWKLYKLLAGGNHSDFHLQLRDFGGYTDHLISIEKLQFRDEYFHSFDAFNTAYQAHWNRKQQLDDLPAQDPIEKNAPSPGLTTPPPPQAVPELFVNNTQASIREGDSGTKVAKFEINLSGISDYDVSFIWSAIGGSADGQAETGKDFKFGAGTVVIPAGSYQAFVPVTVYGDDEAEDNESFSFIVSNVKGAELAGGGIIRIEKGWILDDDTANAPPPPEPEPNPPGEVYLSIETNDPSEYEGTGGGYVEYDFIVRRSGDLDQRTDYKVQFQGYGGTPLTADDFYDGSFPEELGRFSFGEDRDRFTIRVKSDSLQEADEYFRAKLTSPDSNASVSTKYAYAAVLNDDGDTLPSAAGEVYLNMSAVQPTVVEGTSSSHNTPVQFEVTRSGDLNQVTYFRYSFDTGYRSGESPDRITNSQDGVSGSFSPKFEIGQSSYIITKYLFADSVNEPDEYLTARLRSDRDSPNAVILEETASTLVVNDDGPTPPRITATPGYTQESNGTKTAYLQVDLDHKTSVNVSMDYAIGGPFAGTDVVARTGTLTITAGQLSGQIAIQLLGNTSAERVEHVEVELDRVVNGYFGHSNTDNLDTGLVIFDDDGPDSFSPDPDTLAANAIDLGSLGKYDLIEHNFVLDDESSLLVYRLQVTDTMTIATVSPSPAFIFDAAGKLVHANIGSFDYLDGSEASGMADHHVFRPGEYFMVYSGGYNPVGQSMTTEFRGMPSVGETPVLDMKFANNGGESVFVGDMKEGGSSNYRYVEIELSHVVDHPVTFDVEVTHLTTTSADFTYLEKETITIDPGDRRAVYLVRAKDEKVFEGRELYSVTVANVQGAVLSGGAGSFTRSGAILDNDENPDPEFELLPVQLDRAEGSSGTTEFLFKIVRPAGHSAQAVQVDWEVYGRGSHPASFSDFDGNDFPSGTATFAAGVTEVLVALNVIGDRFSEADETFEILLRNPSSGFGIHTATIDGVIRNDDGINSTPVYGSDTAVVGTSYALGADEQDGILVGGALANLFGNDDDNSMSGNNAANRMEGRGGADYLFGRGGNDDILGGLGDDFIEGGEGDDRLDGEDDNDEISGGDGRDDIFGGKGADRLYGGSESDRLFGGSENDHLEGELGDDELDGGDGEDTLIGGPGADKMHGGAGRDAFLGAASDFFGDSFDDLTPGEMILLRESHLARSNFVFANNRSEFHIDIDRNGSFDGFFNVVGDYDGGDFMATAYSGGTRLSFERYLPALKEGKAVAAADVNGVNNKDFLTGDGVTQFEVTLKDLGYAGYNNAVGVYEINGEGRILDVRLLFADANEDKKATALVQGVEAGHRLGFFIVQDAAGWAKGLIDGDKIEFLDRNGAQSLVSDGSQDLILSVNGLAVNDEIVFHSHGSHMNVDGLEHVLSGVNPGGKSITIGFEDLTGGGDQDYEDVAFSIELVDPTSLG